jgi:DNA modification methylase
MQKKQEAEMIEPYYQSSDGRVVLYLGDATEVLSQLPENLVHCCVTSPPYWGLRDYQAEGQYGLEQSPQEFVEVMRRVFGEVRRVLRKDGTCWLNLGDSYCSSPAGNKTPSGFSQTRPSRMTSNGDQETVAIPKQGYGGLKPKDLCLIPARVAIALQDDGWWVRSDIIWDKKNPMPESVTDRPTKSHEYIWLMSKRAKYFYDADAIREPLSESTLMEIAKGYKGESRKDYDLANAQDASDTKRRIIEGKRKQYTESMACGGSNFKNHYGTFNVNGEPIINPSGRNKRDVWTVNTHPYPDAHFATFPPKLITPCILAGTSEQGCCVRCGAPWKRITETTRTFESGSGKSGRMPTGKRPDGMCNGGETLDVRRGPVTHVNTMGWEPTCKCGADTEPCIVLDCFNGSGTSGVVALQYGRNYIGIDINAKYLDMTIARLKKAQEQMTLGIAV